MNIQITSKKCTAVLAYCFNSCGCCTNWQAYGVNVIISLEVFFQVRVRQRTFTHLYNTCYLGSNTHQIVSAVHLTVHTDRSSVSNSKINSDTFLHVAQACKPYQGVS
jgi:hypothetical protein